MNNRIIMPVSVNSLISNIRDDAEARYALKHRVDSHAALHGIWQCDQYRKGELISGGYLEPPNTFTTEGMAYLLNVMFFTTSKAGSLIWYVGIFKNNVTPAVGNTAAVCLGAAGTYGECQDADYDSPLTDKPSYTTATTATASITNAVAGKATFVMLAAITVYGAFLSTVAAKTATTGYLMCGKKFTASRAVVDDDELLITYQINLSTS